ncbi:MAG TPA: ABC transporter ATP-binding protein [Euzebyales bacterium]|nr:ABC transporter ATP-binding protein [Euzebyales bacterium]
MTRRYGDVVAVEDVSLDVRPGEVVGLLGPNGAGKTTLVNLCVGLRRPTAGSVELCGRDPRDEAGRRVMGMTPQETALPEPWRVGELVGFVAAHFPDPVDRGELLARFGLHHLRDRQVGALSGGQRRRLAVALAFTGRPRVVFLDEPTTGLDVEARRALWDAIRAFHAGGGTVVLTSHYLEEVETLAERVVVMDDGRVIADGGLDEVRGLFGLKHVALTCSVLPELAGVERVGRDGARTHLLTGDADQVVRDLVASGAEFRDLEIHAATLEDAFLAITGDRPDR